MSSCSSAVSQIIPIASTSLCGTTGDVQSQRCASGSINESSNIIQTLNANQSVVAENEFDNTTSCSPRKETIISPESEDDDQISIEARSDDLIKY